MSCTVNGLTASALALPLVGFILTSLGRRATRVGGDLGAVGALRTAVTRSRAGPSAEGRRAKRFACGRQRRPLSRSPPGSLVVSWVVSWARQGGRGPDGRTMLKIDEVTQPNGALCPVFLAVAPRRPETGGGLEIVEGDQALPVPPGALDAVMRRYGGPLDPAERVTRVARIELEEGRALWHVRHLSGYDVVARDYLLYETPDEEPRCALAVTVAGALRHLARAALRSSPADASTGH